MGFKNTGSWGAAVGAALTGQGGFRQGRRGFEVCAEAMQAAHAKAPEPEGVHQEMDAVIARYSLSQIRPQSVLRTGHETSRRFLKKSPPPLGALTMKE